MSGLPSGAVMRAVLQLVAGLLQRIEAAASGRRGRGPLPSEAGGAQVPAMTSGGTASGKGASSAFSASLAGAAERGQLGTVIVAAGAL